MKKNFNDRNNNYGKIFCIPNDEECNKKIVACCMVSVEPTKTHITAIPAKKKINISTSFILYLCPNEEIDEEWEELLDDNIDGITYRSSKSSLSYVNKSEKIKGKQNGNVAVKQPLLLEMISKIFAKQRYVQTKGKSLHKNVGQDTKVQNLSVLFYPVSLGQLYTGMQYS